MKRSSIIAISAVVIVLLIVWMVARSSAPKSMENMTPDEKVMAIRSKTAKDAAMIAVNSPRENGAIQSPLRTEGRVDEKWFGENIFSIELHDKNGNVIGTSAAVKGEEAGDDVVSFSANISFEAPLGNTVGKLVYKSTKVGGKEDESYEFALPVYFQ